MRAIIFAAFAGAAALAVLYVAQRSLIYFPGSTNPGAELLPAGAESIDLYTADGLRLSGWFLPAGGRPDRPGADPTAGPAVLICNGNAGDRSSRLPLAEALTERGYAVLLFDYRGYAGNPGKPSEEVCAPMLEPRLTRLPPGRTSIPIASPTSASRSGPPSPAVWRQSGHRLP